MKYRRLLFFLAVVTLLLLITQDAEAQCAMCKKVAEGKGKANVARNLNGAILYLMATPYVLLMFVFRKKIVAIFHFVKGWLFFRKSA